MDKEKLVNNVPTHTADPPQNHTNFVEDGMTTSDIRKTVQYIRSYIEKGGSTSLEDRIEQLKIDCAKFEDRYPMLFEMCSRQEFNMENLNYFLKKRDDIIENRISVDDASKQIGKEWFDKYVDVSKMKKNKK
jgi:hypothetical protein